MPFSVPIVPNGTFCPDWSPTYPDFNAGSEHFCVTALLLLFSPCKTSHLSRIILLHAPNLDSFSAVPGHWLSQPLPTPVPMTLDTAVLLGDIYNLVI